MVGMDKLLDDIKDTVRGVMRSIARAINNATNGQIHPNTVTYIGLSMHIAIAFAIAAHQNILAAILLVIFGLFDTLDGELARLQHRQSSKGMLLDSVTDRAKEVMIYAGAAVYFITAGIPYFAVWALVACGASLTVSYINAWGEVIMTNRTSKHHINQTFRGGLLRFEVRMFIVLAGLLSDRMALAVVVIAVLASLTAVQRFVSISSRL